MLEFNATLIAQAVDLLILIIVFGGIIAIIFKTRSFVKNVHNKIERMDNEIKEIKNILKTNSAFFNERNVQD